MHGWRSTMVFTLLLSNFIRLPWFLYCDNCPLLQRG